MQQRQHSPELQILQGRADLAAEDPDLLLKARTSHASGTHLLLALEAPPGETDGNSPARESIRQDLAELIGLRFQWEAGAEPAPAPCAALEELLADLLPGPPASPAEGPGLFLPPGPQLALPLFHHASAGARALVAPPCGGGQRVVLAPGQDALRDALCELLADREGRVEWNERLQDEVRRRARQLPREGRFDHGLASRHQPPLLDLADPALEAAFEYAVPGGGAMVALVAPEPGGVLRCELGRRARGSESFVVPLNPSVESEHRQSLVLVRRTAPADFGKVLRVQLDDEDLGPWHLGNTGLPGHFSDDVFRVPSEVLLDRTQARFTLHAEPGVSHDGLRIRFLREADPEGLWLTELDPDSVEGDSARGPEPRFDQNALGDALQVAGELFLRGLGSRGTLALEYRLSPGYAWFDARFGVDDASPTFAPIGLRILVDGELRLDAPAQRLREPAVPARVSIAGARQLRLEFDPGGDPAALGVLAAPLLVRD